MNEFSHFLTGYLLGLFMINHWDKEKLHTNNFARFECFFTAFCAFSIDLDYLISDFIEFGHGTWTHTIVGALLTAICVSSISWIFISQFSDSIKITFSRVLLLAIIGTMSHLVLDIVPFAEFQESYWEVTEHRYFWPFSNFPVFINTLFPWVTYQQRLIVEIIYSAILGVYLFYMWIHKGEFFMFAFSPVRWSGNGTQTTSPRNRIPEYLYVILLYSILIWYLIDQYPIWLLLAPFLLFGIGYAVERKKEGNFENLKPS